MLPYVNATFKSCMALTPSSLAYGVIDKTALHVYIIFRELLLTVAPEPKLHPTVNRCGSYWSDHQLTFVAFLNIHTRLNYVVNF